MSALPTTALLLLGAALAGLLLSLPLEQLRAPRPGSRREWPALMVHVALALLLFGALLILLQRALFAAGLVLAFWLLILFVNNAKYRALREPFVFSDFALFSQAFRFPRLYLPFFGWARAAGVAGVAALTLYLALTLEPWMVGLLGAMGFAAVVAALLTAGAGLLVMGARRLSRPSFQVEDDLARFGMAANLWLYWRAEHAGFNGAEASPFAGLPASCPTQPDIVAVQSESFFDARHLPVAIRPALLAEYTAACAMSVQHGRLLVPAWGANTMRSEFAWLTGLREAALGVHRFNPYRRLARRTLPNLAGFLRRAGYRTVCIHPHEAAFFGRDRVFQAMGFDHFIDISAFADAPKDGPYIADVALTAKIREVLNDASRPLFIFAITMENHGPYHLEKVRPGDGENCYVEPPPAGCADLTVYLRHLANADRMIGDLVQTLSERQREGLLCFFGDHVPSLPKVYETLGHADNRSDYLIWRSTGPDARPLSRDLEIADLGVELLRAAGLMANRGQAEQGSAVS